MTAAAQSRQSIDPRAVLRAAWRTERDGARTAVRAIRPSSGGTSNGPTSSASRWPALHVRTHVAMLAAGAPPPRPARDRRPAAAARRRRPRAR